MDNNTVPVEMPKEKKNTKKKTVAKKKTTPKKKLVIVESPSKAKTIGRFLGSRYKVIASVGHVRDLPKSKLGIDIEDDFEPMYINIRGKGDIIKELKAEAKKASCVYLATDPDREGEAISWHLAYLLGIDEKEPCRIVFNEITKKAVRDAIDNPRPIDLSLVDAQQARRVLDRLVGYQISPLLWRKIRRGLSAGRVQSAALKIICDRENEINDFKPEEYWNITAYLEKEKENNQEITAKLSEKFDKKIKIDNKEQAEEIEKALLSGKYVVKSVSEKERIRKPYAPFTTSSLQQDAANKLNFSTRKTMKVAQELYEGLKIPQRGTIGLVSYIRTDSVRVSDEAKKAASEYITEKFGKEYYSNNIYSNRKKEVQDAHEAIRPSYSELSPDEIKDYLSNDQYKLYKLIWTRFIASQMTAARFMAMNCEIENGEYTFKATGSKLIFDGFLKVYASGDDEKDKLLPAMMEGDILVPVKDRQETKTIAGEKKTLEIKNGIKKEQMFTMPPARFTEASLVKDLEEKNIGRPSTYAPIVATLMDRRYIRKEKKSLVPTDLGFLVVNMLQAYFKEIVDAGFTADMENKLDTVETDDVQWKSVIRDFYGDFEKELKVADEEIERIDDEETDEVCEKCGKKMVIKHGRFGEFLACSGYPECRNTRPMVESTGVNCPECGKEIVKRRSRKGKIFYGCSGYPDCKQAYWDKPIDRKCPECGHLLTEKTLKNGTYISCSNKECNYKEKA